jgi:hypothetical protein
VGGYAPLQGSKTEDPVANRTDLPEVAPAEAPDRSRLASGLANAWPPAEVLEALQAGAAAALSLFAAGDVLGARKRWAEVGGMLSRRPKGKRGVARLVTHAGRSQSVSAWARELGWSPQALAYRLEVMPLDTALVRREPKT